MKVWNKRDPHTPVDAVYVGRPTKWGNPFSHLDSRYASKVHSREDAINLYTNWIYEPEQNQLRAAAKMELRNKDLVCWCTPKACHADILMEIANSD